MGLLSSLSAVLLDCQALIFHMAGRKHEQTSVWQGQLHWSFDTNSLSACDVTKQDSATRNSAEHPRISPWE
jgi:hypothetical protein